MAIWVDADACPAVIKEILLRAAQRTKISLNFVANQYIQVPNAINIKSIRVASGFDVADDEIVKRCSAGDLVITSDIPLADELIDKGAQVLTSRGEVLDEQNIKARLNMRDFLETLRGSGIQSGGPAKMSPSDRQLFANKLDQYLSKWSQGKK
ncbi:MAG: YaiI/YqxD family protein [Oceanospirillaceae bacterium]|nr:YaiI/YqxD family protein [Oceanospirillaceae bacterium]